MGHRQPLASIYGDSCELMRHSINIVTQDSVRRYKHTLQRPRSHVHCLHFVWVAWYCIYNSKGIFFLAQFSLDLIDHIRIIFKYNLSALPVWKLKSILIWVLWQQTATLYCTSSLSITNVLTDVKVRKKACTKNVLCMTCRLIWCTVSTDSVHGKSWQKNNRRARTRALAVTWNLHAMNMAWYFVLWLISPSS